MHIAQRALVAFVAFEHFAFFVLEAFFWTKPFGLKTFGQTKAHVEVSAPLAINRGVDNAFLGAGLVWSLTGPLGAFGIQVFFLCCVIIAAVVGAVTAKGTILFVQGMPAAIALALVVLGRS